MEPDYEKIIDNQRKFSFFKTPWKPYVPISEFVVFYFLSMSAFLIDLEIQSYLSLVDYIVILSYMLGLLFLILAGNSFKQYFRTKKSKYKTYLFKPFTLLVISGILFTFPTLLTVSIEAEFNSITMEMMH